MFSFSLFRAKTWSNQNNDILTLQIQKTKKKHKKSRPSTGHTAALQFVRETRKKYKILPNSPSAPPLGHPNADPENREKSSEKTDTDDLLRENSNLKNGPKFDAEGISDGVKNKGSEGLDLEESRKKAGNEDQKGRLLSENVKKIGKNDDLRENNTNLRKAPDVREEEMYRKNDQSQ